jgi:hypothetical protein
MRRGWSVVVLVVLILAGIAIGAGAYNAGVSHGLAQSGKATEIVRVVGPMGFFPFGFLIFPLVFFGAVLLLRLSFGRRIRHRGGPWGPGPWGPGPGRFEERASEWHRQQHESTAEGGVGGATPSDA